MSGGDYRELTIVLWHIHMHEKVILLLLAVTGIPPA